MRGPLGYGSLHAHQAYIWQGSSPCMPMHMLGRAVAQCDKPSAEEVDRLHARFTHDIVALFDGHKQLLPGWEAKQLHVV